jgi:hypothetical protein
MKIANQPQKERGAYKPLSPRPGASRPPYVKNDDAGDSPIA